VIAQDVGLSIPEIFARRRAGLPAHGAQSGAPPCSQSGLVIATGGGMLVDEENRRLLLASGFVVC
jgi:shikimate kinase